MKDDNTVVYKFSVFDEDLFESFSQVMIPLVQVQVESFNNDVENLEQILEQNYKVDSDIVNHLHTLRMDLKKIDLIFGEWQEAAMHHLKEDEEITQMVKDISSESELRTTPAHFLYQDEVPKKTCKRCE